MLIRCLFVQRRESYEGQFAPEIQAAITEFMYDEFSDAFEDEVDKARNDPDLMGVAVIKLDVDQDKIRKLCLNQPTLKAKIVDESS